MKKKVEIKKLKTEYNKYSVKMELTAGEILAIRNALTYYQQSPVAQDIKLFWDREVEKENIE